jgi:hypothetical protein
MITEFIASSFALIVGTANATTVPDAATVDIVREAEAPSVMVALDIQRLSCNLSFSGSSPDGTRYTKVDGVCMNLSSPDAIGSSIPMYNVHCDAIGRHLVCKMAYKGYEITTVN